MTATRKPVDLALQGGGAHGAFTRGDLDRLGENTFDASPLRELRAIDLVARLLDDGVLDAGRYEHVLVHVIDSRELPTPRASSKLDAEWACLEHLRDAGRAAAGAWRDGAHHRLGVESTVDPRALFQGRERVRPPARCRRT